MMVFGHLIIILNEKIPDIVLGFRLCKVLQEFVRSILKVACFKWHYSWCFDNLMLHTVKSFMYCIDVHLE